MNNYVDISVFHAKLQLILIWTVAIFRKIFAVKRKLFAKIFAKELNHVVINAWIQMEYVVIIHVALFA